MILTVDAGNANIVLGGFADDKLQFISRLDTIVSRTEDQYAVLLKDILALYGHTPDNVSGCIISSVVPPVTARLERGIEKICGVKPLVVLPGLKTGLNIKIDDPSTLGSDLVCAAVAAKSKYALPCIFADIGTCLKIGAIDKNGAMLGCVIAPGINTAFEALAEKTASLPLIDAQPVENIIGTNSIDSMRSGVIAGMACMIDGMAERFEEILGAQATTIATGDSARYVVPLCRREIVSDPHLVLEGLNIIYNKNQKK
ncbi:MAG: type III pantothenate kinase [Eubacterium sp.]|nr:type III pantothenate kinase [Eubacterium sp.]